MSFGLKLTAGLAAISASVVAIVGLRIGANDDRVPRTPRNIFADFSSTAQPRRANVAPTYAEASETVNPAAPIVPISWHDRIQRLRAEWAAADPEQRAALLERFAAHVDPAALPELLGRLVGAVDSEMLLPLQRVLFRKLTASGPARAAELARALPPGLDGDIVRLEVALEWADADLPRAAEWLAQWGPGVGREVALKTMSAYLADTDARQAREWITAMPDSPLKMELLEQACARGGGRAFEAILGWAQELPEGARKEQALIHLSYQWEKRDFQAALAYAQSRAGNDSLAVLLANQWVERESKAAAEWAAALPEGERRQKVLASLTAKWAQKDPQAAAEFVYRHLSPGQAQQQATVSVVSAWAAQDPQAVARWVEQFPTGPLRTYAMENVIFPWAAANPDAAGLWLSRLPYGPDRDAALNAGVARLMDARPDLAAQWAASIGDESQRQQKTFRAVRAWLAADEASARNWVTSANLPDHLKRQLVPGQ